MGKLCFDFAQLRTAVCEFGVYAQLFEPFPDSFVALQAVWDQGVEADTVLCPMTQKRKISAFTDGGRLTINQNASEKKVTMSIRVIETDMGTVAVMAERFIDPTDVSSVKYDKILVYKKDIFSRMTLRPVKETTLATTGDSEKRMLVTEMTLKCRTQKGLGAITNLTRVMPA